MTFKVKAAFLSLFEYYTPKIVLIKNIKVGILSRLLQLALIGYIVGFVIVWNKGYQDFSTIESSVTTKLKGVVFTNFSDEEFDDRIQNKDLYKRIWDVADYVVPPSENNAFFVTTNIVITPNQTQRKCSEDPGVTNAKCINNSDCPQGIILPSGNGVLTGECITSEINDTVSVCQIFGWCSVERDVSPLNGTRALLSATKNFTVMIKNFVEFPKFNIRRRNIPNYDEDRLKHCTYHPVNDPLCPIFVLNDIVPGDFDELAVKGAAIAIVINWDCNFDRDESKCFPTYEFKRLDENVTVSPGLNFRYAHYYGDLSRTLFKAYGIKFIILAQGRGGKFSVVPLFLNIGSGLGLLAIASVICDFIVLYIVNNRDYYKSAKYQNVEDTENDKEGSIEYGKDSETQYLKSSLR